MRAPNPFLSSWGVFSQPLFRSSISHAVPIAPRLSLDSVAAALDRGDFESGSDSRSGRLTSDALFPLHRSLRRRGGGLRAGFFWGLFFFVYGLQRHFFGAAFFYSFLLYSRKLTADECKSYDLDYLHEYSGDHFTA